VTELGEGLSLLWVVPFAGMVLSLAVLPLTVPGWFHRDRNKALVAIAWSLPVLVLLEFVRRETGQHALLETAEEYVAFVVLLGSLFTISGGMYLTGNLLGTPRTNVAFLAVGAVLANFIGTTGAACLLIRPVLRANSERTYVRHTVVFTIMVVANVGGLLTPLGDPPLFLGFLGGVDFFWTLRLLPQWALAVGLTLAIYYFIDRRFYARETPVAREEDVEDYVPLGMAGKINVLFLAGVIGAVLLSEPLHEIGAAIHFPFLRELIMVAMAVLSLKVGARAPRRWNQFTWSPIVEVAVLFAGIFVTMIPALAILEARGEELGLTQPWQYFWLTGALSSFLDNAPTYLTFTALAQGTLGVDGLAGLMSTTVTGGAAAAPAAFLAAISCGAVFMGANSYIGNAPNFMVKSIAEHSDVRMPSFFGYMGYSAAVLLPVFAIVTLVFFL
jgi:Na+/H+ antiporter NhaD/arsenite permease-like protein